MPFKAVLDDKVVDIDQFNNQHRGLAFNCRLCDTPMILVLGKIVVHHFRHKKDPCQNYESREHLEMKAVTAKLFAKIGSKSEYEVIVRKGENRHQIDVVIDNKIAVECQASTMSNKEAEKRTRELNALGYPVLWLLSAKNFKIDGETKMLHQPEPFIHGIYFGRIYYLDTNKEKICSIHYTKITQDIYILEAYDGTSYYISEPEDIDSDNIEFAYTKTLKKKKHIVVGPTPKIFNLFEIESTYLPTGQTYRIARFYDKKFW